MSVTSKTGLIPTQRRISKYYGHKKAATFALSTANVSKPAEFSIRPFGGLYNPYAKGCSVLCNHPAPSAVRTIIKKVKDSWSSENKTYWQDCVVQKSGINEELLGDHIPEDLFRRYTDTDSRPLTPSPTTASVRTRASVGSFRNARRCVTPEPGKDAMIKRKKIILDLRRSHSQETLYWRASSEVSHGLVTETAADGTYGSKLIRGQKSEEPNTKKGEDAADEAKAQVCINERDIDDGAMQRRGKRRKKSKQQTIITTFHISQDPETQIATLGPDSLSASTRPSLVPGNVQKLLNSATDNDRQPTQLQGSFLTEEAFRVLKTELDIDIIENTFERYLNRALREAIKFLPGKKSKRHERDADETEQPEPPLLNENNQIPRKFSKSASRFEVPVNLANLENYQVFDYLSKHVWVSRQRKQLYKRIFLKYLTAEEVAPNDEENIEEQPAPVNEAIIQERTISNVHFRKALEEILGFYRRDQVVEEICQLIALNGQEKINFRSWCGLVSFAERFALTDPRATDSCDELEKADFDTLEQRISDLNLVGNLRIVLEKIRGGHCVDNG